MFYMFIRCLLVSVEFIIKAIRLIGPKKENMLLNSLNCKGMPENSCILVSSKSNPIPFVHSGCSSPVVASLSPGEKLIIGHI